MFPRGELEELLGRRLTPVVPAQVIRQLIIEIESLSDAWEEMDLAHLDGESCSVVNCVDCWLEEQRDRGIDVRVYLKRNRLAVKAAVGGAAGVRRAAG
jgi:hypothetical protein